MTLNNFIYFDNNYVEELNYYTATGLDSSTVAYLYDNRSDKGYCTWNTSTGDITITFDSTITASEFLVLDHNFELGFIYYKDAGGSFTVVNQFDNNNLAYYLSQYTITSDTFKLVCATTTTGEVAQCGEFVITNRKFHVNYNPSEYMPQMSSIGNDVELYDGRRRYIETSQVFRADVKYKYLLGDSDNMIGTDLQNMTELCRQKVEFMFYPNAGLEDGSPDAFMWRPRDIYKCQIMNNYVYEISVPGRNDIIRADYQLMEVK